MHRALWLTAAVLILVGVSGCGSDDEASSGNLAVTSSANHSWNGYHWARTSNPFTLQLGDNVSSSWDSYLATASSDWSQSTVLDTTIVPGHVRPKPCKATDGRVEVCNATYGSNGWLGVATVWLSGDHITKATVKVNDSYFNTATYNTPAWRQLVICQEIGHTFGLDHQDENFDNPNLGTCMDYTRDPDGPPSNEHPNKHDYDELVTIYTDHLDTTTTVGQTVVAGAQPGNGDDTPAEWGRLIHASADGRLAVYELDLGGGERVLRFVIRA